jgi:hypothetical protein
MLRQESTISTMTKREEELMGLGWEKRFMADEPRLSEMKEMYESIGFDVLLEPLPGKEELASCAESGCTACMDVDPDRYRVIYTRAKEE